MMRRQSRNAIAPAFCLAMLVGAASLAIPTAARGETNGLRTSADFLAQGPEARVLYVAGLSDQLTQLHQAGLIKGFRWYERCAQERGPQVLSKALTDYIAAEPARAAEPAARNFIWAAAQICGYP